MARNAAMAVLWPCGLMVELISSLAPQSPVRRSMRRTTITHLALPASKKTSQKYNVLSCPGVRYDSIVHGEGLKNGLVMKYESVPNMLKMPQ